MGVVLGEVADHMQSVLQPHARQNHGSASECTESGGVEREGRSYGYASKQCMGGR